MSDDDITMIEVDLTGDDWEARLADMVVRGYRENVPPAAVGAALSHGIMLALKERGEDAGPDGRREQIKVRVILLAKSMVAADKQAPS